MKQHFLHRKGKTLLCMFTIIPLLFNIAIVRIGVASPNQTKVYVDPPIILDTTLVPGKNFTINVNVFNVTNLYGYEIHLYYNTTLLDGLSVDLPPGHFLTPVKPYKLVIQALEINDAYNATHGRVLAAALLLYPEPAKNGSGTLITVTFEVTGTGSCFLDLNPAKIGDPDGIPIPHEDVDGHFSNVEVHEVAVIDVKPYPTEVPVGENITINVKVWNVGSFPETFNVTVYYDSILIDTQTVVSLGVGATKTLEFTWNTAGVTEGDYTIKAEAILAEDYDPADNWKEASITILGHDVAVIYIKPDQLQALVGENITIDVKVKNLGGFPETFDVTVYANETISFTVFAIATQVITLEAGETTTPPLEFIWDTTGFPRGEYTIRANASTVPGEINTENNVKDYPYHYPYDPVTLQGHDIAVTSVTASHTAVMAGDPVTISVTIANEGDFTETFNVTAYYDNIPIKTENVTDLLKGDFRILTFEWNTTGVDLGTYTITANITIQYTDTWTGNNVTKSFNTTRKPVVQGSEKVYVNKTLMTKPANYTINYETGNITFTSAPGNGLEVKAIYFSPEDYDPADNSLVDGTVDVGEVNIMDHPVVVGGFTFHVITESNSTIPPPSFNFTRADKKISFNVTGPDDTVGFCNVTIPKRLLDANATHPWLVLLDGMNITDTTSIAENATHTFIYFTYTLSTHKVEIIGATVPTPPVASFTISPDPPYLVGDTLTFDASASEDPDGEIVSYEWDFDDGTVEFYNAPNGTIVEHAFMDDGTYEVTLTVTDNDELTNTTTSYVTVLLHNIAITYISPDREQVLVGENITIDVIIRNKGSFPETFDVAVYYDSIPIDTQTDVSLGAGATKTLSFTWNTAGVAEGKYNIKAEASVVPNETDTDDNVYVFLRKVTILGHDVAITNILLDREQVLVGENITIHVTVENQGFGETETFNVTVYANETAIATERNITLEVDETETLEFIWNTTGFARGEYTIRANASTVPYEINTENNVKIFTRKITLQIHDVAVTSVTASHTSVMLGDPVTINVTVANEGDFSEIFNVTVYYNENILDTQTNITLSAGANTTLPFSWNTTNVPPSNYTISAKASVVPNEADTANNTYIDGIVEVKETPTPPPTTAPVILYVAVTVAIVVIIATIVIYFVRFRKS